MGMDAALSTLKSECAEQGLDYEEVLHQRATEIRLMKELELTLPDWRAAWRWLNRGKRQSHRLRNDAPSSQARRQRCNTEPA
jgi:capsid protein